MKKLWFMLICMMFLRGVVYAQGCITAVSESQILYGKRTTALLWAKVNPPSGTVISRVWAIIYPPNLSDRTEVDLSDAGNGVYEKTYDGFSQVGGYNIDFHAEDTGNADCGSMQSKVSRQEPTADGYEQDDVITQANPIVPNNPTPQQHNFHDEGDTDWVKFYRLSENKYALKVNNLDSRSNAVIEIYAPDGTMIDKFRDETNAEKPIQRELNCTQEGIYYVKVYNFNPSVFAEAAGYDIAISIADAPMGGRIEGKVRDAVSNFPICNVKIKTNKKSSATGSCDGYYVIEGHPDGDFTLTAEADCYQTYTGSGSLESAGAVAHNISMQPTPKGDINGDNSADLRDAIQALKILSGISGSYCTQADVNGDNKLGMEEVIYILQKAVLR